MAIYRIYYTCGFWGDEIAKDLPDAKRQAEAIAAKNETRVVKVEKRKEPT